MIKIVGVKHKSGFTIEVAFSDGSVGDYDLSPIVMRDSSLTLPLRDPHQFKRFFIDAGALCWPNGLELSPASIQHRLKHAGLLRQDTQVA